jgi:hypothetical protein
MVCRVEINAKVMEKNWQGLQNIMLYHATADSLAYIGEDSSLDLFFDEFLSVTDPIKIICAWGLLRPTQNCFFVSGITRGCQ